MDTFELSLRVDPAHRLGPVPRVWAAIGYDELNWTYSERGKQLHHTIGTEVLRSGYSVRMHNTLTSGNGLSTPAWGSGDVYHELDDGTPRYRWDLLDRAFDVIVGSGGEPLVELGFMPRDLGRRRAEEVGFTAEYDLGHEPYESGAWKQPPRDLGRWADLVQAVVAHQLLRYGADRLAKWRFEVWNEPDLPNYWHGSPDEYVALFRASAAAARSAFPKAQVGGPATSGAGTEFLRHFLGALDAAGEKPDFVSFHTKGAAYRPRRHYNHFLPAPRQSPSTELMLADIERNVSAIRSYPRFRDLPIYVDECDPAVGTIYGIHDNPNFVVNNSEYYPAFACNLIAQVIDRGLADELTQWAFLMEGKRWFEGNRTLVDNQNVEKPILNGLRLLERLAGGERVATTLPTGSTPVGAMAALNGDCLKVLLWHHRDPWWEEGAAEIALEVAGFERDATASVTRLDHDHANSYRAWEAMGSPPDPLPDQVADLRRASLLEPESLPVLQGRVTLHIPLHGLALLELSLG